MELLHFLVWFLIIDWAETVKLESVLALLPAWTQRTLTHNEICIPEMMPQCPLEIFLCTKRIVNLLSKINLKSISVKNSESNICNSDLSISDWYSEYGNEK